MRFRNSKKLLVVITILLANSALAEMKIPSHRASQKEAVEANRNNRQLSKKHNDNTKAEMARESAREFQPAIDTADFAYVLLSASESDLSEVTEIRRTIASHVPETVKLVLLATSSSAAAVRDYYSQYLSSERIIIAESDFVSVENGFWARDAFPFPVVNNRNGETSLVWSQYFRPFNAGSSIASAVGEKFSRTNKVFVGGNLLADSDGHCFSVQGERSFGFTEKDYQNTWGCNQVTLLPHRAGIGDVDEVIKILPNKNVLTSVPEYTKTLEDLGYQVHMLPRPGGYRTYLNSLIVGKTVFMPAYGVNSDSTAQGIYEQFGYQVFPLKSNTLSNEFHGSVHCQTMAYPAMNETRLLENLHLKRID